MSAAVSIVNYGLGNVTAFANIYNRLGIAAELVTSAEQVDAAHRLILPGVGAFDWAMERLDASGLRAALNRAALHRKIPVLGVCVGMQMMLLSSDEGRLPGLGWINGHVSRFQTNEHRALPLPHMGWNDVQICQNDGLFRGIADARYYFLHSYKVDLDSEDDALATAAYGTAFTAAVRRSNIHGTQFHPEKSHQWGIDLLKNFSEL